MTSGAAAGPDADYPSVALAHGDYVAEIGLFGGALKALTYRGAPLVESYEGKPPLMAGVVLAPWPNRTEDGWFEWQGTAHQLGITEPERNNAIHGFAVDWWHVKERSDNRVALAFDIEPRQGWPWAIQLEATYTLDEQGLYHQLTARTTEPGEVPFAYGLHLYLSPQGAGAEEAVLSVDVGKRYQLNARNLPTGKTEQVRIANQPIAEVDWDDCFHGEGPLTAVYSAGGKGVRLEMGEGLNWVQMFTPADFPRAGGPGKALAVEPMSAPPNALRSGEDLVRLSAQNPQRFTLRLAAENNN
ncbi:aldose epimerase [uncultured Corynebacterium sp.]|uniref:aldose epimerase family protein n=1 Tax=uncultured Corynebacterium sp. TaxID=159447 RepID=UPI002617C11D|nr:aldose epimerase [uncultured Corynebacterium sp.]